jgi:predicted GIY-YIG superfamily endonuclease
MSNLVLYRWFNKKHHLLYVGITRHIGRRIKEHAKASDWSEQAAYITLEKASSIQDLQQKERQAIESERPLYNLAHNSNPRKKCFTTVISKIETTQSDLITMLKLQVKNLELQKELFAIQAERAQIIYNTANINRIFIVSNKTDK